MKKLLFFITLFTIACSEIPLEITDPIKNDLTGTRSTSIASTDYYWLDGEKIPLQIVEGKYFVMFDPANEGNIKSELTKVGAVLDVEKSIISVKSTGKYKRATIKGTYEELASALSNVYYWAPYYKTESGQEAWSDNQFSVKLKSNTDLTKLKEMAKTYSLYIVGEDRFVDGLYRLECAGDSWGNAVEMGNMFHETGMFEYACANLAGVGRISAINEPLYANGTLWHLGNNTTNPNITIKYDGARSVVPQASSSIIVAVVDAGVQINHPDLYNVLPGWDAESGLSPNVITHSHGTHISGLIGAIPNNGQAAAGIAYGVKILPVSFKVDNNGRILSSANVMVRAVEYAVNNGAKIINCSWDYSHPDVAAAVKEALNSGCIMVFASGNNGLPLILSPANSDPRILVVGAVTKSGIRANFSSYGGFLDVAAPGQDLASTTVGSGYAIDTGISGTSYAAPIVSGIAALLLSVNPNFTAKQVCDHIEKTAQKVGGYAYETYPGYLNGTSNDYLGYGLVNAFEAVVKAKYPQLTITGPDQPPYLMYPTTYSVPAMLPTGVTFNGWEITPADSQNGILWTSGPLTNPTLNITLNVPTVFTIKANFTLPDGTTFAATKVADMHTTFNPRTGPSITPMFTRIFSESDFGIDVVDPHPGVRAYEWEITGQPIYTLFQFGNGSSMRFKHDPRMPWNGQLAGAGYIRCRAHLSNGIISAWSEPSIVSIGTHPFREPTNDDEEEEEGLQEI